MIIKKKRNRSGKRGWWGEKTHLGKYFNCLLRFGAHHKRSICAPQSRVKGETQMVLRTKQWKPSHELGKVKPIYLTIYLLWVCLGLYEGIDLVAVAFIHGRTVFDCANWSAALKSQKSWEDRILWTACKMCNEYLSLFIFARFRYFNVSSPLLLWVSATCGAILRHATQRARGGGESGCLCTTMFLIYDQVRGHFPALRKRNVYQNIKEKSIWISTECVGDDLLKVQINPTLALSFRVIKVNVIRESREHSFSQDNMENFTAFIPS